MLHTFEYYVVDPGTWKDLKPLTKVKKCTINRDSTVATLGSADIDLDESIGECYIRAYLVTIQNGITEKFPLGTFLVQTLPSSFDGKISTYKVDAYTPLIELKEKPPPFGYSIMKGSNILNMAYELITENMRAPVVRPSCEEALFDNFVSTNDDTWLSFTTDLITQAKYSYDLDEMGRVLFAPDQNIASLQPVWTYTDDNASILYPEISINRDLFNIPNVVEVMHSSSNGYYYARVVNDDEDSPVSTVSRGREIVHRVIDPDLIGDPTNDRIKEYANKLLKELSSIESTITYKHAYCPVRLGDCVRINCVSAGLIDVKAKIISQTINCEPGCPVSETAVFTTNLWR